MNNVGSKIVANVEHAGAFVTSEAIDVLGGIRLATTDRSIVDGMRISVAGLERQAVAPVMFEGDSKSVIEAGSDVALIVHGAEGIFFSVGIEKKLIQRTACNRFEQR